MWLLITGCTPGLAAGKVLVVKNCIDLGGTVEIGSFAEQAKNSWLAPFVVTDGDFISIDLQLPTAREKSMENCPIWILCTSLREAILLMQGWMSGSHYVVLHLTWGVLRPG